MSAAATAALEQSAQERARRTAAEFDLRRLSPEFLDDPYPTYRALRQFDPIHRMPDGSCFLARYDDCLAVYRDVDTWSSDKRLFHILPTTCSTTPYTASLRRPAPHAGAPAACARVHPAGHARAAAHRALVDPLLGAATRGRSISFPVRRRHSGSAHRRHAGIPQDERGRCAAGRSPSSARASQC